jgi:integrase
LAPASINQKMSAIRKLAVEAAHNGLVDAAIAQGIREVRGAKAQGRRTGNWLTKEQSEQIINAPDTTTLKGKRDRAILAVLIGCGLRRAEVAHLSFQHIQERDGRWCIVDLVGKHSRLRTIPMSHWTKIAIDEWTQAAKLRSGYVFRGVNKGDRLTGESLNAQGVLRCVLKYTVAVGLRAAPHDLRQTYAKLSHKGGAKLDQIQLSLGHASLTTTERYLGIQQDLTDAPCDYLQLDV